MNEIIQKIVTDYGLLGIMLLAILFVVWWATKNIDKKDIQITKICDRFADSLDANTKAMNELCLAEKNIVNSGQEMKKEFEEMRSENEKYHEKFYNSFFQKNALNG